MDEDLHWFRSGGVQQCEANDGWRLYRGGLGAFGAIRRQDQSQSWSRRCLARQTRCERRYPMGPFLWRNQLGIRRTALGRQRWRLLSCCRQCFASQWQQDQSVMGGPPWPASSNPLLLEITFGTKPRPAQRPPPRERPRLNTRTE